MAIVEKPVYSVRVRELVEFVLRRGDLRGERDFVGSDRALAGTRGHQRLQRSRPAGYQKEVSLTIDFETDEFVLRIRGRLDGLLASPEGVLLEEIKTVQGAWDHTADPLHWAQAKCYGFILARDQALPQIVIQLAYVELETGKVTEFRERFSFDELSNFFERTTAVYLDWIRDLHRWRALRDRALQTLAFPFAEYRPGRRELAVAAWRALADGGRLFLEAPTGIGKTISVLFPALKAMGEGKVERIFYLTARTVGRTTAEQALADLRKGGLAARCVTLTAKEKVCVLDGRPCDPETCPMALGYYDRCRPAMRDALDRAEMTRAVLEAVGREHQVCPFALSLDVSLWADVVICDYNYVFDPTVYLRRYFAEDAGGCAVLVDEAHNLVDRAREMFSAELESREIRDAGRMIKQAAPRCARALAKLNAALGKLCGPAPPHAEAFKSADSTLELNFHSNPPTGKAIDEPGGNRETPPTEAGSNVHTRRELPLDLLPLVEAALKETESWLARNQPAEFRETLLQLYFRLHSFRRTAELYDEHYATIIEPLPSVRVRLFCLDPSVLLGQTLKRCWAAVFFSATLTPIGYYRALLGGTPGDRVVRLPSPFPAGNLAVFIQDRIQTHFRARAGTLGDVAQAIRALVSGRDGNYLVFLPSYQYLAGLRERFQALCPEITILAQGPGMTEPERDAFLAAFAAERGDTLVGFAVLGGIFGEGIDLTGERLIGAVIVGVGLPQLCVERDLIRDYFQVQTGAGFDYAYTFPGMNRVLQAIGRVIRSETDCGVALLIDTRFAESRYRRLFPEWWQPTRARSVDEIRAAAGGFWKTACAPV